MVPQGKGVFNLYFFVDLFSNSVYSLMFHHSLPNIINDLNNNDAKYVLRNAFLISSIILFLIPITGVMAFGKQLSDGESLKYYNYDFQ
jgi:amino acid permease